MTPEEQRVAIAEALGFKWYRLAYEKPERTLSLVGAGYDGPSDLTEKVHWNAFNGVPDVTNDANDALKLCDHLATKGWNCELSQGTDKTWECTFKRIASKDSPVGTLTFDHDTAYEIYYHPADTLPEAICGAFLRTIGKWKD